MAEGRADSFMRPGMVLFAMSAGTLTGALIGRGSMDLWLQAGVYTGIAGSLVLGIGLWLKVRERSSH